MKDNLAQDYIDSPIGFIQIAADDSSLKSISFSNKKLKNPNKITNKAKKQLEEYFSGKREKFDLPLDKNGTDFQKKVWQSLEKIPFGKTCSYKDIAKKINNENASRAVGNANNKNNFLIVIPCHRVVANDGSLAGYASGTKTKKWLLTHEQKGV